MYAAPLATPFSSCPTPAVRNKRVRKAVEKWEPPVKAPKRHKKK
jgi:hypothetical protein